MAIRKIMIPAEDLRIDRAEFARRMGMPAEEIDPALEAECLALLRPLLQPAAVWDEAEVRRLDDGAIDCGFGPVVSQSLTRYLRDCDRVILMARLASSPARRLTVDALGSAAAESLADEVSRRLSETYDCLPRFSPGYGDVPLSVQPAFLDRLDAGRQLGIRLTESFLMIPGKSITAIAGIRRE